MDESQIRKIVSNDKINTGNVIGVKRWQWYVAIVNNCFEKVILLSVVFVRVTESERLKSVAKLPYIKRFMVDISRGKNQFSEHPIAIIPNNQFEQLCLMLEYADTPVIIGSLPFHLGDRIRIAKEKLKGLEGNVIHCNIRSFFHNSLTGMFGVS